MAFEAECNLLFAGKQWLLTHVGAETAQQQLHRVNNAKPKCKNDPSGGFILTETLTIVYFEVTPPQPGQIVSE